MFKQWFANCAANDFDEQRVVQRTIRGIPAISLVLVWLRLFDEDFIAFSADITEVDGVISGRGKFYSVCSTAKIEKER